jgi:TetR/AcrR family transcriptional regulator, transcriptional repressor for nem operon
MKHFTELTSSAERIVDVAEALIRERGFNGFSYEDIAREVGIRKPSIHHHFAAKADLGAVVAQRYTHRFHERLVQIEQAHADPAERLHAYAGLFQQTYGEDRNLCVCGILGAESGALPEPVNREVRQFFRINQDWLARIFTDIVASTPALRGRSPGNLATLYLSALEGAMLVGRASQASGNPLQAAEDFIHLLRH